ncbi:MAG: pirin-like C-terminal cupin domain-containing protein, partial [Allorhizobium sp.]
DRGASGRVVIGGMGGLRSPVTTFSETLYVDLALEPGARFPFDAGQEERALYILSGEIEIAGDRFAQDQLLVFRPGDENTLIAGAT